MEIRLSNPTLIPDLIEFVGRAAGIAVKLTPRGGRVDVAVSPALDRLVARRQLFLYIAAWEGLHPGVAVDFEDDGWHADPIYAMSAGAR